MPDYKYIGHSSTRIDGREKVTGAAQYVDDIDFGPDLLHAAVVESPHAHALIKGIDTTEAEAVPGVVKVATGKDFPYRFGLYMKDRYIFAQDRVRFVGEQVAAVVARASAAAPAITAPPPTFAPAPTVAGIAFPGSLVRSSNITPGPLEDPAALAEGRTTGQGE